MDELKICKLKTKQKKDKKKNRERNLEVISLVIFVSRWIYVFGYGCSMHRSTFMNNNHFLFDISGVNSISSFYFDNNFQNYCHLYKFHCVLLDFDFCQVFFYAFCRMYDFRIISLDLKRYDFMICCCVATFMKFTGEVSWTFSEISKRNFFFECSKRNFFEDFKWNSSSKREIFLIETN